MNITKHIKETSQRKKALRFFTILIKMVLSIMPMKENSAVTF